MSEVNPGDAFLDLELSVEVWLGTERVALERLLELKPGRVLPLGHDPDGPVDLVVNGSPVARGELVVVDGRFGFRVQSTSRQNIAELESPSAAAVEGDAAPVPPPTTDDGHDRPAAEPKDETP